MGLFTCIIVSNLELYSQGSRRHGWSHQYGRLGIRIYNGLVGDYGYEYDEPSSRGFSQQHFQNLLQLLSQLRLYHNFHCERGHDKKYLFCFSKNTRAWHLTRIRPSIVLTSSNIARYDPNLPPFSAHSLCPYSPTSYSHSCLRALKRQGKGSCVAIEFS